MTCSTSFPVKSSAVPAKERRSDWQQKVPKLEDKKGWSWRHEEPLAYKLLDQVNEYLGALIKLSQPLFFADPLELRRELGTICRACQADTGGEASSRAEGED